MSSVFYENTAQNGTVKSIFGHLDSLINAIDKLEKSGIKDYVVTSPLPRHDLEEAIYKGRPSPVRWFTLTGTIFGGTMGFSLASITHLNWPMIIPAGKPLVSIPAFMIITFESSVLWGCLFTLLGMVILSKLHSAKNLQTELCDPRFSDDKFGIIVNGLKRSKAEKVTELLSSQGALEVYNGYVLNDKKEKPKIIPLDQRGIEPDELDVIPLAKLALILTIFIIFSIISMKMLFDFTLANQLNESGYNYKTSAVAPSHRIDE
tara:strand:- start:217 stop:1002 length:786 start_codon:yes stop_codon:yes gene_type:complete